MFFDVALLSGNHVPDRRRAQKSGKLVEVNSKIKNNWNRNYCCNE